MPDTPQIPSDFISQITVIVEENISKEQFGVSELADAMHMSRSNLLRRVKKETKLSVSQLISQIRLKRGMALLRTTSANVSEVSHQVGFNSTSYFIKCFREYYGYPPGEAGKRGEVETYAIPGALPMASRDHRKRNFLVLGSLALIAAFAVGLFSYYTWPFSSPAPQEKSIAVLPFKNDSNDSTNLYLINGLMESTLNNLQKIKDLKVISRTSAEKYRHTSRSIPEMAKELNVNYFVEGSGQKIGDRILLNIQLIEASTDKHLWSKQYRREASDIFDLQLEIAKDIAAEIQVIITPEEKKRIEKNPTHDLVAYDFFLKGEDFFRRAGTANLERAVVWFKKAIEKDSEFALAYAGLVTTYYYLDAFQLEKKYAAEIDNYADQALLFDPTLAESLIAKALSHMYKKDFQSAVPYLEKALEYNPNSVTVINFLADFYCNYLPNTTRYLEYALKGIRLDITSYDSATISFNYLRMSNALMQTGFIEEAIIFIDQSLAYNPQNPYSSYVKAWILFARDRDFKQAKERLVQELKKDTTRIDILQDVAKLCFLMRDFKEAYKYYKPFIEFRERQQLDIYKHENMRIAIVLDKMGQEKKSQEFLKLFKAYADHDKSIYGHLALSEYYAYTGDLKKAIEHLNLFTKEDNYQYWVLLYEMDAGIDPVRHLPEFKALMKRIETKFWDKHKEIRVTLEGQGLL